MKSKQKIRGIAVAAIIAACYVVLTFMSSAVGLSSGTVQIRFSESLAVLPVFTPYAIPGLFIGCLVANILTGCTVWDIVLGSLATLVGAILTRALKDRKILSLLPPIIANTLIIPFVLIYAYSLEGTFLYFALTVFSGEVISCGILGSLLRNSLQKRNIFNKL